MNCRDPRYPRECGRRDGILLRASAEQRELLLVSRRGTTEAEAQDGNCTRRSTQVSNRTQGHAPNLSVCRRYGANTGGDEGEGRIGRVRKKKTLYLTPMAEMAFPHFPKNRDTVRQLIRDNPDFLVSIIQKEWVKFFGKPLIVRK